MTAKYTISLEDQPSSADLQTVETGLVNYNEAQTEPESWRGLAAFLRDDQGQIAAGLAGCTHYGWLYVSNLWVSEALRGQGYGRQLMLCAEQEAAGRGCRHAHLDTFDFQALPFYQKLGYEIFGTLQDFPTGHSRYFLQKRDLRRSDQQSIIGNPGVL